MESKEDMRVARIRASRIIEEHCRNCDRNMQLSKAEDLKYCRTVCPVGMQLAELGNVLDNDVQKTHPNSRTKEVWDEICQKALEMRRAGATIKDIREALKVTDRTLYGRLKERGLNLKPEGAKKAPKRGMQLVTPEMVADLRKQGLTLAAISAHFGYASGYINQLLHKWRKSGVWVDEQETPNGQ